MNNKLVFGFIFCQFLSNLFVVESTNHERKLIKDLLKDYEPYERPTFNDSAAVDVKHGLTLLKLDLDADKEILTSYVWMNMEWQDVNLQWNQSDYGGINSIRLPPGRIWIPDIIPYNALDYNSVDPHKQFTNIVITSSGDCTWIPPMVLKTTCKIDLTTSFFTTSNSDVQDCKIKVGSWTYNGFTMNLISQNSDIDTSSFVLNQEWQLMGATAQRNEVFYECCAEPYLDITYIVKLKKRG